MSNQLNATKFQTRDSLLVFLLAPDHVVLVKTPLYTFVFILGIFGNLSVLTATLKYKSLRKPTNTPIALLCIYDILLLFLGIPVYLMRLTSIPCRVTAALHVIITTSIVLTLITIALQRYTFIVHPLKTKFKLTYKKISSFILLLNFVSTLSGVPVLVAHVPVMGRCLDTMDDNGMLINIVLFMLHYVAPMFLMTYLYACSWYRIRQENGNSMRITGTHFGATYITAAEPKGEKKDSIKEEQGEEDRPRFSRLNSSPDLGDDNENVFPHSPFMPSRQSRQFRRSSLQVNSLKPRSCSVVSTQSVDRHPGLATPKNIIRSLSTSLNQTQRSVTSLLLGVEIEMPTEFTEKRSNQTLVTLKMFVSIIAMFGVCMLPHHLVVLIPWSAENRRLMDILDIFVYINATTNPFVYGCINGEYITGLTKLFWGRSRRKGSDGSTQGKENSSMGGDDCMENKRGLGHCMAYFWKRLWSGSGGCAGATTGDRRQSKTSNRRRSQSWPRETSTSTFDTPRSSNGANNRNQPSYRLQLSPLPIIIITPSDSNCDF